jgi:ketosteroid isomerase-like protein
MDASQMDVLTGKMIRFLETGDTPEGLFRPDVFLDLTMPTRRVQAASAEDLIAARKQGHPGRGTVTRWRADPTPSGFVFEFEERWNSEGQQWYAREMMRIEVTEGAIAELTVYCTGDWDEARQAEHAAAVTLSRP